MKLSKSAAMLLPAMALTLGSVFGMTGVASAAVGERAFQNVATHRCIDDSAGYGLRSFGCNGLDYQEWNFKEFGVTGHYSIYNTYTGRCIDDSAEYGLRSFGCNGLDYQEWKVVFVNPAGYGLQNVHTGRCIDDSAGYGLRSFGCNGQIYQAWNSI